MKEKMLSITEKSKISFLVQRAISGVHNGFVMNTHFFCLDAGFAGSSLLFLCQFGDVLYRNALAGIGGVGFIVWGFGDIAKAAP